LKGVNTNMKEAEDFYFSAADFCKVIENTHFINESNLIKLLRSLLELYSKALFLPEVETENNEVSACDLPIPKIDFGNYDLYWEVFDPYHFEEPVGASLADDILDIYKDVKNGIILYEKNDHIEAVSEWKSSFDIHWGNHAVDAIRALHSVRIK
jgi:hypothetical protein